MKVKVSWVLCIDGIFDCNKLQRYLARLSLKLFIHETIGQRGTLVKDLWSLGVPYSLEGCDPTGYIFSYVLSKKSPYFFKVLMKRCNCPSFNKLKSFLSFLNLQLLSSILYIALS